MIVFLTVRYKIDRGNDEFAIFQRWLNTFFALVTEPAFSSGLKKANRVPPYGNRALDNSSGYKTRLHKCTH